MGEIDVIRKATWQLHSIWIITKAMSSFHQCGFNFWWFFWHFSRLSVICSYYFSDIHISRFTASSNLGAAGSGSKNYAYLYIYVGNRKLGNGFQRSKGTGRHWCLTWFCDKHNNIKQCQQLCRCDFSPRSDAIATVSFGQWLSLLSQSHRTILRAFVKYPSVSSNE